MLKNSLPLLSYSGIYSLRFRLFVFFLASFVVNSLSAQHTSSLRGLIVDAETHLPLQGASVVLSGTGKGTQTGAGGMYKFDNIPVGRYIVSVSFVGYQTVTIPEVLVESGKEQIINISLTPSKIQLEEATVVMPKQDFYNSAEAITIEQTLRYAATYLDPARAMTSFPGVAAAHDQANGLVVRGNSPNGMQWRLEGVEVVNPNHHSNAGTFSDRATQTGGGVNILSTQMLGTSYFLSGAFPAGYGNVLSGVMDMHLRNGNDEKHEFTAQAGLIGFDVAAEGPLSKKSKASYLVNYRYSFTGLLAGMGVDFGGETINFQDLSFKLKLPAKKAGEFSLFGVGGLSSNLFRGDRDSSAWESQKDLLDVVFKNKMGAAGLTHNISIGKRTGIQSVLVYSALMSTRTADSYRDDVLGAAVRESDGLDKSRLSFSTKITHRFSPSHRIKAGVYLTGQEDGITLNGRRRSLDGYLLEPFATWQWNINSRFTTEAGLHYLGYTMNNTGSLEPRASVRWQVAPKQFLSVSYGRHSQTQSPQTYLGGVQAGDNRELGLTRAHHFVAGYQHYFRGNVSLKLEAYLQSLSDVPVGLSSSAFSTLNLVEMQVGQKLRNGGRGRNSGLELTLQKYLTKSYYMIVSGSLYKSEYAGSDGVWRSTRFNGGHTFAFTGGKEFYTKNQSTWGVNLKLTWLGGFRDTPVDAARSSAEGKTVYVDSQSFTIRMRDYFRPDLRVYWKKNREKYSRTLSLDIQNVAGIENDAFSYYDFFQKKIVLQKQLGMIPVLSYRWEF